ncbi:MAG: hypothetical protein OHK0057_24920 [Thermoflexibacter sp.]
MHTPLFSNFDFSQLDSPDFKEDSVREVLILPILQGLGYAGKQIVRSKALANPFLKVGSQKRQIKQVPDYLLKTEAESLNYAWVLDAKAPNENITEGENVAQVYSYAIHPEVKTKFSALCNGKEFILFRQDEEKPLLYFSLNQINSYWDELQSYLAPSAFQSGKDFSYTTVKTVKSGVKDESDYINRPLLDEMPVQKRTAKRHFGVHGYFTKQSWNVVRAYIEHFSNVGDLVLDPFGGSGVTAIEALMSDRRAIHIDLNPMSVFIVSALLAPVKINELMTAFERVKTAFIAKKPQGLQDLTGLNISYPQGFRLPKGSDVQTIEQLFTEKQLAQLAFLKHLILKEKNENIRNSLLLAFSSSITKANLTYHNSGSRDENAGNSAVFAYYRYRVAKEAVDLDLMNTFETKFKKILSAKKDVGTKIDAKTIKDGQIVKGTATNLDFVKNESVDYIYTDPPYGKKIPYLDLSIMWNAWLDLPVTEEDYEMDMFDYDEKTQKFHIRKNKKFQTHIDLNLRIRYYLLSYLRRMELENKIPTFDDIVLNIMPLLKNGITPENQTILSVLKNIATPVGNGWRLMPQGGLF